MGRTRLRGMEIGGLRIAVEVPAAWAWDWPPELAPLRAPATDPHLYVSVRVGACAARPDEPTVYEFARGTFEVGRRSREWVAVLRDDLGTRVARFDPALRAVEVAVAPRSEAALAGRHPLAHPLDELLVLHRVAREGGLLVRGALHVHAGRTTLRLGAVGSEAPGVVPGDPCDGRVLLRPTQRAVHAYTTPWGGGAAAGRCLLGAVHVLRGSGGVGTRRLDADAAVGALLSHLVAPIHCPDLAARGAAASERVVARVPVLQVGVPAAEASVVPFAWDRREAALGFAPPVPR